MSSLQQQLFAANFMLQGVRALSFDLRTSIVLDQFAPTPPGKIHSFFHFHTKHQYAQKISHFLRFFKRTRHGNQVENSSRRADGSWCSR